MCRWRWVLATIVVGTAATAGLSESGSDTQPASCCPPGASSQPAHATQPAAAGNPAAWTRLDFRRARQIPVQYKGRVMPLDSMARQVAWQITGRRSWEGHEPTGLLLAWSWQGRTWFDKPIILVRDPILQAHVGLPTDRKRFSYNELSDNAEFMQILREADQLQRTDKKLDPLHRNALQVWTRMSVLFDVVAGRLLRIVPPAADAEQAWTVVEKATGFDASVLENLKAAYAKFRSTFEAGDVEGFNEASAALHAALAGLGSPAWPDEAVLKSEVFYNVIAPFRIGWVLCFLALAAGLVALPIRNKVLIGAGVALLLAGFAAQSLGIVLRWRVGGHAPFATMYESLVFMGWGATAIGLAAMAVMKHRAALPIVAAVATAVLVVADTTPLDWTVSPLVPVLRNTMWLTYHVLTIMLGYSAFALALGVGHVQAVLLSYRPQRTDWTRMLGRLLYGIIMTGIVFLTAGIIFGAVWANKSWGRYWGWDPKETWSLITLLGYMAVLHGRRAGWFGQFALAIASIVCFQLVIMTYYGVNFVLGVGLHSYGFGSGGLGWMLLYELAELLFVAWMCMARAWTQRVAAAWPGT